MLGRRHWSGKRMRHFFLTVMSRRMNRNKWIVGILIAVLIIAIVLILYFKFVKQSTICIFAILVLSLFLGVSERHNFIVFANLFCRLLTFELLILINLARIQFCLGHVPLKHPRDGHVTLVSPHQRLGSQLASALFSPIHARDEEAVTACHHHSRALGGLIDSPFYFVKLQKSRGNQETKSPMHYLT